MSRIYLGASRPRSVFTAGLLRVLVLALLPVVGVFVAQPAAQAAPWYGDSATASFGWASPIPGRYGNCDIGGYNFADASQVDQYVVKITKGRCDIGWNEKQSGTISLSATGTGCSFAGETGLNDGVQFSMAMTGTVSDPSACNLTEICWEYHGEGWGFDTEESGCTAMNLGPFKKADQPTTGCALGAVAASPPAPVFRKMDGTAGSQGYWEVSGTATLNLPRQATYQVVLWYENPKSPGSIVPLTNGDKYAGPGSGIVVSYAASTLDFGTSFSGTVKVYGVQVVIKYDSATQYTGWNNGLDWNALVLFKQPAPDKNMGGITYPSRCSFYFGKQIADHPGSLDEPVSDLAGPAGGGSGVEPTIDLPAPTEEPGEDACSFTFSDPTTWASAGVCALVQLFSVLLDLLGQLLDVIAGLVDDLLSGLLDLLRAAFVPDGDYIEAQFAEVRDAYSDTAPGAWVEALSGFSVPSGSSAGCQGPHVDVNMGQAGIDIDTYPLNACSGAAATLAALCKIILTATIAFFGGLACIRAVGSGFNWNPGVGSGGNG